MLPYLRADYRRDPNIATMKEGKHIGQGSTIPFGLNRKLYTLKALKTP